MRPQNSGFTLIEILIVLVIISIVTAVALLTINQNQKKAVILQAENLIQLMELTEQKALLWPGTLGFQLDNARYKIVVLQNNSKNIWQDLHDRNLRPYAIPKDINILLKNPHTEASNLKHHPQIIFFENGEITPFKILIGLKNNAPMIEIAGHANGEIKQHAYQN